MTREFLDRNSSNNFQPPANQFAPRPFASAQQSTPEVQAKTDSHNEEQVQQSSSDRLARISITPPNTSIPRMQTKLTIGEPGDKYEQEADTVARKVVNDINSPQFIQRQQMPKLQMKPMVQCFGGGTAAPPDIEASIQKARGSGQPLSDRLREPMEQAFGADFSGVRVHTDAKSDLLNQSIQAKAFTTGSDIFFRQGAYEPSSRGGQELIAHELTHVVQQNSGMVMRKVAYENPSTPFIHEVQEALKIKFTEKKEIFKEEDRAVINTILTTEFYEGLFAALRRLSYDEQDYGTFDLNNDQHLMLLFYEIKKHLPSSLAKVDPIKESEKENEEAKKKKKEQEEYFAKSPRPGLTFETAFLGAGAATAYYLTTMGSSIDRYNTIVIGPTQPWEKERGPGVINHPMHMITALREEVGLGDESLAPRKDFSEIVEQVLDKYVIHRRFNKINKVSKISNEGAVFYQIEVDNGVNYYAKKVVAGLGIGPHITPKGQTPLDGRAMNMDEFQNHASIIKSTVENPKDITVVISGGNAAIDSVMTAIQNEFTIIWVTGSQRPAMLPGTDNETVEEEYDKVIKRQASKILLVLKTYAKSAVEKPEDAKGEKPIIVNTDEGSIPADYFVYAMGPDISKVKDIFDKATILDNLVPTYDKNRQFGGEGLSTVVGLEVKNEREDDKTSLEIIGGSAFRMAGDVKYDYMLRQWDLLNQTVTHMAGLTEQFTGLSSSRDDGKNYSEVIQGMKQAYETACDYRVDAWKEITHIQHATEPSEMLNIAAVPDFSSAGSKIKSLEVDKDLAVVREKYLSDLRFIESYAKMLIDYGKSVFEYLHKKAEAESKKQRLRDPDPRTAAAHMSAVIETLPLNIAVNDQLTPTRSQIEATQGFVPKYVSEDVNFATDSSTVLSIYISVNFPNLEPKQVDEWVDRIVRWRRPSDDDRKKYTMLHGPIPNPNGKDRENARSFGNWFKKRLAEENAKAAKKHK